MSGCTFEGDTSAPALGGVEGVMFSVETGTFFSESVVLNGAAWSKR